MVPVILLQPPDPAGRGLQDPDGGSPCQRHFVRGVHGAVCLLRAGGGRAGGGGQNYGANKYDIQH